MSLSERWRQFWFEPTSPVNLGLCRAFFFGLIFLWYLTYDFSLWAEVSVVFWQPTWLFTRFHLPVLSKDLLIIIQILWKVALGLSCLGLFTRVSTATSFILGVYLLGLPQCFGKIHHNEAILVLVLAIMALSRCGDGFSLDRLIRSARRGKNPSANQTVFSGEYTWPVRTVWLLLALIFFGAGVAKLRHTGLEWVFSDNFAIMLIQNNYHTTRTEPLTSWGLNLAQHGWLCRLLAAATVVIEISYPLALFSRAARQLIVPAACLMLIGIRVVVGPAFEQFLICSVFWVPWDCVSHQLTARLRIERSMRLSRAPSNKEVSRSGG